jgi:transcriptional regulator with GAF, ATPase, and Fis domain
MEMVRQVSGLDSPVLLLGETGVARTSSRMPATIHRPAGMNRSRFNHFIERKSIDMKLTNIPKLTNGRIHGPEGAAELLGINPSTLRSEIKKFRIKK